MWHRDDIMTATPGTAAQRRLTGAPNPTPATVAAHARGPQSRLQYRGVARPVCVLTRWAVVSSGCRLRVGLVEIRRVAQSTRAIPVFATDWKRIASGPLCREWERLEVSRFP